MPPSRGSGGSHRSSSSHRSGPSRSSSGSFSSHSSRSSNTYVRFGGYGGPSHTNVYIRRGRHSSGSPLTTFIIFTLIFFFVFISIFSGIIENIGLMADMRECDDTFRTMISAVDNHQYPDLYKSTYADVVSYNIYDYYITYNGEDYYQLEFEFYNAFLNKTMTGYTYYCYSEADVMEVQNHSYKLKVAYSKTNWIDCNYSNDSLTDNINYKHLKASNRESTLPCLIFFALTVIFVFIDILYIKSTVKKKAVTETPTNTDTSTTTTTINTVDTNVYCSYCGSILADGETKCPSCGAKIKKTYN